LNVLSANDSSFSGFKNRCTSTRTGAAAPHKGAPAYARPDVATTNGTTSAARPANDVAEAAAAVRSLPVVTSDLRVVSEPNCRRIRVGGDWSATVVAARIMG